MIDRLLLVGYGSIGKLHLRIARETLPDADIRILRHRPVICLLSQLLEILGEVEVRLDRCHGLGMHTARLPGEARSLTARVQVPRCV